MIWRGTLTVMLPSTKPPWYRPKDSISGETLDLSGVMVGSAPDPSRIFTHDKDLWMAEASLLLNMHSMLNR